MIKKIQKAFFSFYLSQITLYFNSLTARPEINKIYNGESQVKINTIFHRKIVFFCFVLFDSLRPINNLSVMRDGSSWVEPVLS